MSAKEYRTASSVHGGLLQVSGVANVAFGDRVEVRDRSGRGEVVISYGSLDELDEVLAALGLD